MQSFTIQTERFIQRNLNISDDSSLLLTLNKIKVDEGNTGLTILAVGYVASDFDQLTSGVKPFSEEGAVQLVSLGNGNAIRVFKNGNDFVNNKIEQGPFFLNDGQTFVIEKITTGSIITMSEGGYGYSEQRSLDFESPMPLLSLGLAFSDTLFYSFRNSTQPDGIEKGLLHIVCGPKKSKISLTNAITGDIVLKQSNITLDSFSHKTLTLDGNVEYRIKATEPIMACTNVYMGDGDKRFYDGRLILPLTNDGISWPRNGQISALYPNTKVKYYNNRGDTGTGGPSFVVDGPGNFIDADTAVGNNEIGYSATGATRFMANGLISGFSGADGAGFEATPMCPISAMAYKIPIIGIIRNTGTPQQNSISVSSPFVGTIRVYTYDTNTELPVLVSFNAPGGGTTNTINLERRNGVIPSIPEEQRTPSSAQIAATASAPNDRYGLQTDFLGGYIISDVPCMAIINTSQTDNITPTEQFPGSSGNLVQGVRSAADETLVFGISPDELKCTIRLGTDDLYYKQTISSGGTETWLLA